MALQPLTPTGVQDKQDELYILPDSDLKIEAETIRTDFRVWMNDNFSLTPSQETYLDNLPDDFVHPLACDTSTAVGFRLPITLVITGTFSASKLIRTNPSMEYSYDPTLASGGFEAIGSLEIEFVYLP